MDDDDYIVDLDSDREEAESSEDEINIFLHGTPEQKRRMRRRSLGLDTDSEDDFEKQMEEELNVTMKNLEDKQREAGGHAVGAASSSGSQGGSTEQQNEQEYYDADYFDSESDEETSSKDKKQQKHPKMTNDELLYDPDDDDDNQLWVDQQRYLYQPKNGMRAPTASASKESQVQRLPNSDAVLNCPACMTLLCLDCQRHDRYHNQYRAMFVMNCSTDISEVLRFPKDKQKGGKKKRKDSKRPVRDSGEGAEYEEDVYHPVKCTECTTEVGVYDKDEVYHFFNVLSSYS